jgi:hypothetical protein
MLGCLPPFCNALESRQISSPGFPALFIGFDVSVAMVGSKHENQGLKRKQPGRNPAFQKNKAPRLGFTSAVFFRRKTKVFRVTGSVQAYRSKNMMTKILKTGDGRLAFELNQDQVGLPIPQISELKTVIRSWPWIPKKIRKAIMLIFLEYSQAIPNMRANISHNPGNRREADPKSISSEKAKALACWDPV